MPVSGVSRGVRGKGLPSCSHCSCRILRKLASARASGLRLEEGDENLVLWVTLNALQGDHFRTREEIIETPDSVPVLNRAPEFVTTE